jgi:hypothetical protein
MRHLGGVAAAVCALVLGGPWMTITRAVAHGMPRTAAAAPAADAARGGATAAQPALWRTYDMIVNLQKLPRTYTCDELWYEFHGILLQLGAWSYSINILPYHCSPTPSGDMKSPDVQVHFQLPFFLQGPAAKYATAKAVERTIRLSPGEPKTLHPADCELMQQISQTLLASLPVRLDQQRFDCSAAPRRAAGFKVAVTLPVTVVALNGVPGAAPSAGRAPR